MLAKAFTVAFVGADARVVEVEVRVGSGLPGFKTVGLAAKSVTEAEQRIRSAIEVSGQRWPGQKIVANLAPAALPKEGTHFDLALALGVVAADGRLKGDALARYMVVGELGLDGSLRGIRGALSAALACAAHGYLGLICPQQNATEAALVKGIEVVPVTSLSHCLAWMAGTRDPSPVPPPRPRAPQMRHDFNEVRGQETAKRAMEIAAAGGHNLLLIGPPGSGKTMLARRMSGVLPEMTEEESLEVTQIHSVAGLLGDHGEMIRSRPFRMPHHHITAAGLVGGGSGLARPGEITLAHHGVLFLDELTLYRSGVLENLRGPLEDRRIRIARSGGVVTYPCRFSLVGAMNPCACGYFADATKDCRCSYQQLQIYRTRVSGPLLDRFDMQVLMTRLTSKQLLGPAEAESSDLVRRRVEEARRVQSTRFRSSLATNASAARSRLERSIRLSTDARAYLSSCVESLEITGRGLDRVLRVSRTIADLDGTAQVSADHVGLALGFRPEDIYREVAA